MRVENLTAIQHMISATTNATVVIGALPPLGGYALSVAAGSPIDTFFSLATNEEMSVQFTGKGSNQVEISSSMDEVHKALTRSKNLPYSSDWQIYAIETTSAPQMIGREQNINYIYGSSFRVKFYAR